MMNSRLEQFSNVPVVWQPNGSKGESARKLRTHIEDKYKTKFSDYWQFHKWTVNHPAEFWGEMWDFTGIIYSKKYDKVMDTNVTFPKLPEWFEGAELNYAENLLKYRDSRVALIMSGEDRDTEKLTYAELYEETKLFAAAFRKFGLKKGDIVMCYMSNRKEAVVGMLAAVSIGALWTGTLPQVGHKAVLSRVSQVNPKILLTVDRFLFNNEEIEMLQNVEEIAKGLPSLQKVIIVPSKEESKNKDISKISKGCFLDEFLALGKEKDGSVPEMTFEQVPLSYPVMINYTSGTTGIPKALIHDSGLLLMISRDYVIQLDCKRGDVYLSMSPVGWASWCIFSTILFQGLTVVLYEGTPYYLTPTHIWDMVDEYKLTHLLLMASVIDELEKRKYLPTKKHNLSSLKVIIVGGTAVKLRSYDFVYNDLKLDVLYASLYGCTEVMGLYWPDLTLPIHKGECQVPPLGSIIESIDETTGQPVEGEVGELVLSTPTPGVVAAFFGDKDGSMFRNKYLEKYPGKFFIGDSGIINPVTKGLIVCGRCDDTLKQRGCRFGPAEIYNVVENFSEVFDSICASQYNKDLEERAILFLKMNENFKLNDDLVERIRKKIAQDLTPRHVPDVIIEIEDIPFNINGKKMELLVKKVINNFPCKFDSVRNPENLKYYKNKPELDRDF